MKFLEHLFLDFCISATSSKNFKHCSPGGDRHNAFGSPIQVLQNGNLIATIPAKFRKFEHCLSFDGVDLKNDNFQFKLTGDDNVCITELSLNNQKILTGQNNDRQREGFAII